MSLNEKTVDEKTFKECCDLMLSGRMHPEVAAYLTGLSRPTFYKRVNQYYDPEKYGELPEDFFSGRKGVWKENTGWIKNSVAVQRYISVETKTSPVAASFPGLFILLSPEKSGKGLKETCQ